MNPLNSVLTAHEASSVLGVSPRQVQRLCKSGKLECRYADGVYLILRKSVEDYKAKGE